MPAGLPWRHHPLRWVALAIAVVVLALLAALAIDVHALLQPQRFTNLLERELAGVGIELKLQAPATPALFPRPAVRLQGFSLTNRGADKPILTANGATIVVPWGALLHRTVAIERVDIDSPHINLGQLQALLARLPQHRGPPRLPTIAAGVHMRSGTLTDNGTPLLFEISVDTGELVPGHHFRMAASAHSASGRSIDASLDTVPSSPHGGSIVFAPIELRVARQNSLALQLAGKGTWAGGESLALHLQGTLQHAALTPPPASSARPAPSASSAVAAAAAPPATTTDQVTLDVQPAHANVPLTVALQVAGSDTQASFTAQPGEFGSWWEQLFSSAPGHPPKPLPITGEAKVQKLDLGWLKASGISIEASP
ncbi:MAG TPA: hypothetical protein VF292_13240, partial [Rhodanobacteraceae bacterium]